MPLWRTPVSRGAIKNHLGCTRVRWGATVRTVRRVRPPQKIQTRPRLGDGESTRTVGNRADGCADDHGNQAASTVRAKPLKLKVETDADGEDANFLSQSGPEKDEVGSVWPKVPDCPG